MVFIVWNSFYLFNIDLFIVCTVLKRKPNTCTFLSFSVIACAFGWKLLFLFTFKFNDNTFLVAFCWCVYVVTLINYQESAMLPRQHLIRSTPQTSTPKALPIISATGVQSGTNEMVSFVEFKCNCVTCKYLYVLCVTVVYIPGFLYPLNMMMVLLLLLSLHPQSILGLWVSWMLFPI